MTQLPRTLLLAALVLSCTYSVSSVIALHNDSGDVVSDITISSSGFSERFPLLQSSTSGTKTVFLKNNSSLTVEFTSGSKRYRYENVCAIHSSNGNDINIVVNSRKEIECKVK